MPKIVDKKEKRAEIARIALGLFAEHGLESTSISQVAQAAGMGKGTIYEYFDSKTELIYAALLSWTDGVAQGVEQLLGPITDPVQQLRAFARASVEPVIQDPRLVHLMLSATHLLLHDERFAHRHNVMQEMSLGYREALKGVLLRGVDQGVFRPEIAEHVDAIAINLFAFLDGIAFHYMIDPSYFDPLQQVDRHLELVLQALRA